MKMLRGWIPVGIIMAVLMFGTTFAQAGTIVTGLTSDEPTPCVDTTKTDFGTIVTGFVGTIVTGFAGTIVTGFTGTIVTGVADTTVDCGTIVTG